jgi:hypothetical protein
VTVKYGKPFNKAMPWLRWLVIRLALLKPGFTLRSIHVGFVVEKVALGQVFIRVLWFSPFNIIPPRLNNHIIWRMNNRPIGGQSSEAHSHSINMNNHSATQVHLKLIKI